MVAMINVTKDGGHKCDQSCYLFHLPTAQRRWRHYESKQTGKSFSAGNQ